MLKDYSDSMILVSGRNKITAKRRSSTFPHELFPLTKFMWKTLGAVVLLTLVVGISSTIWYGLQVQVALDQIGSNKAINIELNNENKLLAAQRDLMLTPDHMQEATQKLGLISPAKNQLRYR